MKRFRVFPVAVASFALFVAGCGQSQAIGHSAPTKPASKTVASNKTTRVLRMGATAYQGASNLSKYEQLASTHQQSYEAQIEAGTAAEVNNDPQKAIQYWQQAIKIDPKKGNPYEYIGNIYLEDYNNPKEAMTWYKKSITYGPSYDFGWYRVVQLEVQFGDMSAAKKYAAEAAKVLPKGNKVLANLETFVAPKKG